MFQPLKKVLQNSLPRIKEKYTSKKANAVERLLFDQFYFLGNILCFTREAKHLALWTGSLKK
jgi:hypothetical protein